MIDPFIFVFGLFADGCILCGVWLDCKWLWCFTRHKKERENINKKRCDFNRDPEKEDSLSNSK